MFQVKIVRSLMLCLSYISSAKLLYSDKYHILKKFAKIVG